MLRKQIQELLSPILIDRKNNKKRTLDRILLFAALFVLCFAAIAAAFVGIATLAADYLLTVPGMGWLYFTLAGVFTLAVGLFGSIFATYSMLYQAKDNEMLLSMPIPASAILLSRMIGVYLLGFAFAALTWVPCVVVWAIRLQPGFVPILLASLMLFVLSFVILALSCLLGWVVALVASRIKNKNVVVTVLSILGVGLYYYLSFNAQTLLESLLQNSADLAASVKEKGWLLYEMSIGAAGDTGAFLLCLGIGLALAVVTWFVLNKTFFAIVTTRRGGKKTVYKEERAVARSAENALLRKEFKRFTSSAAYMLNCGLGCLFLPALAVILIVKSDVITPAITEISGAWAELNDWLPLVVAGVMLFIVALNDMTAPSISLEAKNLWIVKSMPVDTVQLLNAKQKMAIILTLPLALILTVTCSIVLAIPPVGTFLLVIFTILAVLLQSVWGLTMNLKLPNLHWVNETAAVKSGASVVLGLFGGWVFAIAAGFLAYLTRNIITPTAYFICVIAVMAIATVLLNLWVRKRGPEIIASL